MKAHVIQDGMVVNTIVVDSLDFLPNLISAENGGQIGDSWDGETFTTPAKQTPVPTEITPRQGQIILIRYGLDEAVTAYIDSLSAQEKKEAIADFNFASVWLRDWPLLCTAATALGLTDAQVDQMFIEASTI